MPDHIYNNLCPICKSSSIKQAKNNYLNLYSELISQHLNLDEDTLFLQSVPMVCSNCQGHFWYKPLSNSIRSTLYSYLLPQHPKGSDSVSDLFTRQSLFDSLNRHKSDPSRCRRILDGYVRSFNYTPKTLQRHDISLDNINSIPFSDLQELFELGPREYSRFSGFASRLLQSFLPILDHSQVLLEPNCVDYVEIGCPNWGLLHTESAVQLRSVHLVADDNHFWGTNCNSCVHNLHFNLKHLPFSTLTDLKLSTSCTVGLFLILDHYEDPILLLSSLIKQGARRFIIILEDINLDKGLPIQHLTGWTLDTFQYLTKTLNLKALYLDHLTNSEYICLVADVVRP